MLEVLHRALVFFRGSFAFEGAEIAALSGFWILLAGIQPVLPGFQFAYHGCRLFCSKLFSKKLPFPTDSVHCGGKKTRHGMMPPAPGFAFAADHWKI
jgi:hypothetical protein